MKGIPSIANMFRKKYKDDKKAQIRNKWISDGA